MHLMVMYEHRTGIYVVAGISIWIHSKCLMVLVGFGPAVGRCAWRRHRFFLSVRISSWKDISEAAAMLTWIPVIGVLARIQLLRETSCCERSAVSMLVAVISRER
ncbi:hypothetical protein F511_27550 [Dorcoceras hygrometricum]|uniref:Uncharacterized protein n=1 Tax=Dorcoceras hygrometricum TaxID=472368 RepID=A0A2Z7C8X6_9LAMI|nr:hypothetical protein F511_27550 [Dorcoceras hygrometricum]